MSSSPVPKKQKTERSSAIIGTHSGTFHCDEALAVFLLRQTSPYKDSAVKRSRDPAVLDSCDIVVDVGAVYDDSKQRYDHHQRGFDQVFGCGFNTKLSSAGLIYKHFGKSIIADHAGLSIEDPIVHTVWLRLYRDFIEAIDAIDNGISQYPTDLKPRYTSRTDLSSRVGRLNPRWNQKIDSEGIDQLFYKASQLTGEEFMERLNSCLFSWLPARDIVLSSINSSKEIDPTGRIIIFTEYAPWKEHLFDIEAEQGTTSAIYVVYPDEFASNWRVQAVPVASESFESRKALPEKWRGLRDDILSQESGIEGCIFVHASGFIGGNKTKEGALKLAGMALEM